MALIQVAKWLAIIGLALTANSLWQFALISLATSYSTLVVLNTLLMLGISMLMMPVMTNALNELPPPLYPHSTAIISTLQQVAGAAGTALLVTIMMNSSKRYLEAALDTKDGSGLQILAMMAGMKNAFLLAFGLVALAWFVSFFLKPAVPPEGEVERERVSAH